MTNTTKLLAGALLAGMGIAAGQATLTATAAGVGVNWLAEGLSGGFSGGLAELWAGLGPARTPLADAYARALGESVASLEEEYRRTVDPRGGSRAFGLVAAYAGQVADGAIPPDMTGLADIRRRTASALAALLHGHDPRQVEFLTERLLPACAVAFQRQLIGDDGAWRAFHGQLLQGLAANSADLLARIDNFTQLLAAWSDPVAPQAQLARLEAQISALARPPQQAPLPFDSRGQPLAITSYHYSAHAQSGGHARVVNYIGGPSPAAAAAPTPAPVTLLFLAANPLDAERLRLDAEARGVDDALRLGRYARRFRLAQRWAVRSDDLLDALLRHRPGLVHFSGHAADSHLLLEDGQGYSVAVSPGGLVRLLAGPGSVRCVLLNACWSDDLADALLQAIPCVVGMGDEVEDGSAIRFASGFYRSLADGASIPAAVEAGRGQMEAGAGGRPVAPVHLRLHAEVDGAQMRFV